MKDVTPSKTPTPNADIDKAIKELMRGLNGNTDPTDTKVKVVALAINWEKVKHNILESGDGGLDPTIF